MARVQRRFSNVVKQEVVRLVTVRRVSMAQAARDLSLNVNLLRTWVRTAMSDAAAAIGQPSTIPAVVLARSGSCKPGSWLGLQSEVPIAVPYVIFIT